MRWPGLPRVLSPGFLTRSRCGMTVYLGSSGRCRRTAELVMRARRIRSRWQQAAARAGRIAETIAATEDELAGILVSVAALRPLEAVGYWP